MSRVWRATSKEGYGMLIKAESQENVRRYLVKILKYSEEEAENTPISEGGIQDQMSGGESSEKSYPEIFKKVWNGAKTRKIWEIQ